ncbi:hypothetical protein BD413DRAFT_227851 [Trametes elegans]|nr:hypothetical protein BD413DRAFT_227851 [Trametes elegans]
MNRDGAWCAQRGAPCPVTPPYCLSVARGACTSLDLTAAALSRFDVVHISMSGVRPVPSELAIPTAPAPPSYPSEHPLAHASLALATLPAVLNIACNGRVLRHRCPRRGGGA